jgi:SAM-dependent methyltransferase
MMPKNTIKKNTIAHPELCRSSEYRSVVRNSRVFRMLKYVFGADFVPYNPLHKFNGLFLNRIKDGAMVLNCGSGSTRLAQGIINLDIEQFPKVDVVADGCRLPFPAGLFDAVISDTVIEHVKYPALYVSEIKRVLKPGGVIFIIAPFVHPYHGYPSDFQRYSIEGIKTLFEGFEGVEYGVYRGPSVALVNFISDYLAWLFCEKDSPRMLLKAFFTVLLFPLKFLDLFLNRRKTSFILAHSVYYIGKKC